jgi:hypothetical protein
MLSAKFGSIWSNSMVLPVAMYGCEVWGFEKNNILESFCLQFYKILLGLEKSTPNCILYGELGRYFFKILYVAFLPWPTNLDWFLQKEPLDIKTVPR